MKIIKYIFLIFLNLMCIDIYSQVTQENYIISSGGGSSGNGPYINYGIFGEVFTGSSTSGNFTTINSYLAEYDDLIDNHIAAYEYWFDDNYAGRIQAATTGDPVTFNIETDIDVSGLPPGVHFFHIRFQDNEGKWSGVISSFFIVPWQGPWSNPSNGIVEYEYWIDDKYDDKFSGTAADGNTFTIVKDIDYNYLNRGLHFFHYRVKDSEGKWSGVQSSFFVIPDIPEWENPANVLTEYEYWIDDRYDQKGGGTINNLASFNITEDIDYSYLNRGLHFFHYRVKDSEGKWSGVQSSYFVIPDVDPWSYPNNNIVKYEYWLDDDYAGKVVENATPGPAVTLNTDLDFSSLNQGLHFLHIRFMDEAGLWSGVHSNYFIKPDEELTKPDSKIAGYRYWYDNDLDNMVSVTLDTPVNPYQLITDIFVPDFEVGTTHSINIQFEDTEGFWTGVQSSEFNVNTDPVSGTITTHGLAKSEFAPGESVDVSFDFSGYVNEGNTFIAQLSDANGDFTNPVDIGSITSTGSGTIPAVIPISTLQGSGYRIRVASSNPVIEGSDNGSDLSIIPPLSCGDVITSNTTLTQDLDCSGYSGPAITIGADGITLDLNGHQIISAAGQVGVMIPDSRSNITITSSQPGGKIDGEGNAIDIYTSSYVKISNLDLSYTGTTPSNWGIHLLGSVDNLLIDNVVANNRSYALFFDNSQFSNVEISNSNFDGNSVVGIALRNINGLTLTNTSVQDNTQYGVIVNNLSGDISISNVDLAGCDAGLTFDGQTAPFPTITDGMFTGFGTCKKPIQFRQGTSNDILIKGVDLSWTGGGSPYGYGIYSNSATINNLLIDDVDIGNRTSGIILSANSSSNDVVIQNSFIDNNTKAIQLYNVAGLTMTNTSAQNNTELGTLFSNISGTISISGVNVAGSAIGVWLQDQPAGFPTIEPGMFTGFGTNSGSAITMKGITSGITLSGLDLSWTGTSPTGRGIHIVDGNISDLTINGVVANNRSYGLHHEHNASSIDFEIINSNFDGNYVGMNFRDLTGLTLTNTSAQNSIQFGMIVYNVSGVVDISNVNVGGSDAGLTFDGQTSPFPPITEGMFTGFGTCHKPIYFRMGTTQDITISDIDLSWTGDGTPTGYGIYSNTATVSGLVVDGAIINNRNRGILLSANSSSSDIEIINSELESNNIGLDFSNTDGLTLQDNLVRGNGTGLNLASVLDHLVYHNNFCNSSTYHVTGNQAYELWNQITNEGNYWCLTCDDNGFIPGTSSNRPDITDDFAYGVQDGWLLPPGTQGSKPCNSNQPPIAICKDLTVNTDEGSSTASADINNGSYDPDGDPVSLTQDPSGPYPVGTTTVTLTVTDSELESATCTGIVTVVDNEDPVLVLKNITVDLDESGNATITPEDVIESVSDNSEIASIVVSPNTFDGTNLGENTVTVTVTDIYGNTTEATTLVTITDTTPPTVVVQDITVELDASGTTTITPEQLVVSADDNSGIASIVVSPNTFDGTNLGENTVTVTVTDLNGNTTEATAVVTITDTTPPIVLTQPYTVTLANGTAAISPSDIDNGSNDASGIQSLTVSPESFGCDDIGEQEVVLTVTDMNGNTSSSTEIVTVIGQIPEVEITVDPEYTIIGEEPHTIYLGLSQESVELTASGGTSYSWSSDPAGLSGTGASITVTPSDTTTFTVLVTNEYGCSAEESVTIMVVDWRCGNNMNKIMICHNGKTICVAPQALDAHLAQGDYLGPCYAKSRDREDEESIADDNFEEELVIKLEQNYPNPFASYTELQYFLTKNSKVQLALYNSNGKLITTLIDKYIYGGWHSLIVNGSGLANGAYILRMDANGKTVSKVILKTR